MHPESVKTTVIESQATLSQRHSCILHTHTQTKCVLVFHSSIRPLWAPTKQAFIWWLRQPHSILAIIIWGLCAHLRFATRPEAWWAAAVVLRANNTYKNKCYRNSAPAALDPHCQGGKSDHQWGFPWHAIIYCKLFPHTRWNKCAFLAQSHAIPVRLPRTYSLLRQMRSGSFNAISPLSIILHGRKDI